MKLFKNIYYQSLEITCLLASMTLVLACEGECIVGITDAFIGNFTVPMETALGEIAKSVVSELIPGNTHPTMYYVRPLVEEFNKRAYDFYENAIFKTHFHGKCIDSETGIEPAGCPDPDCPIVCGTPGSLIHFYSDLRYIAFNSTTGLFAAVCAEDTPAYRAAEKRVVEAAAADRRRSALRFRRYDLARQVGLDRERKIARISARSDAQVKRDFREILGRFRSRLVVVCGGTEDGETNGLPNCSWKRAFHDYILSFP